ncbi:hypothetical protein BUALT_Bualt17G0044000 [Buddleja alternifolia]|uniref:AIPP2-like SPOC-like domain-containing protein n=1 Tax=Buddleja alternifolia TaxID=168488 RepID=A0AAV6WCF1_9LAMI|nr:hypothetical protein BUALT_Bualt17G0044000 [Buddleja alternifolia]
MYTIVGCGIRLNPKITIKDDKEENDDLPKTHSPSDESHHDRHVYAEPLIRSIWGGRFNVYTGVTYTAVEGFSAFVSSKACKKVYEEAVQFPPVLRLDMLLKSCVWPKSFEESGPSDDSIAIYFFPTLMKYEGIYDTLVFDMITGDLALRAFLGKAELLIFTSLDLPLPISRFQGKIYLWGALRGKM